MYLILLILKAQFSCCNDFTNLSFWKFSLFWQISEKVLNIAFYTKVTPPSLFSIFVKCTFDEFVTLGHFRTGDCHPLLKIDGCPVTRVTRAGTTPVVALHQCLKFAGTVNLGKRLVLSLKRPKFYIRPEIILKSNVSLLCSLFWGFTVFIYGNLTLTITCGTVWMPWLSKNNISAVIYVF